MLPVIGVSAGSMTPRDGRLRYYINASYVHSVVAAGGAPLLIPPGLAPDALAAIWERLDGLLLTGGHDLDPALYGDAPMPELGQVDAPRDATELWLARRALEADLPTLG
ncbi:MAG: gamma-glutamyl-gamma-aminobutyrate hydrolase family protein, partial [Chloroflexi bacterium]|nr:gamma-glutamyl-gamma-aminobutyrate hydrolase family protein [Chloroflexota bacterium]